MTSFSVVIATYNAARLPPALPGQHLGARTTNGSRSLSWMAAPRTARRSIIERNQDRIGYWRSEPDNGIYDAWNKALDHVTGDWVLFLGADDRLAAPDVLERAAAALEAIDGEVRIAYGSVNVVDSSGRLVRRIGSPWADLRGLVTVGMPIGHQGTFHRRRSSKMSVGSTRPTASAETTNCCSGSCPTAAAVPAGSGGRGDAGRGDSVAIPATRRSCSSRTIVPS